MQDRGYFLISTSAILILAFSIICGYVLVKRLSKPFYDYKIEINTGEEIEKLANDLILCVDAEGKFVYVNQRGLEVLEYTKKDIEKLTIWDILRKDNIPRCMQAFDKICRGEVLSGVEAVFMSKNGKKIYVEGNINAQFKEGKFVMSRGIFRDITERKHAEKLLKEYSEQLEKKVEKRTKKLDKMKSDFMLLTVHELGTPLTILKGNIDLFKLGKFGKITREQYRKLIVIEKSLERISELKNRMFDLSLLKRKRFKLFKEPLFIHKIIEDVLESIDLLIKKKSLKVTNNVQELPLIKADKCRIRQVVTNLINNAIEYTPKGGKIVIDAKEDNGFIQISIKDNGIGIPKGEREKIFEEFYQVEDIYFHKEGFGLGLSIAKGIVETHGGKIWCESRKALGSVFHFTLPRIVN